MHNDYLSELFSDADIPMFMLDTSGVITHWNAAIAKLLDVDSSDFTGIPIDTALHSIKNISIREPINVSTLLRLELSELNLLHKGESARPEKLKITCHAGPDEQHILCIGHHITQQEEFSQPQKNLQKQYQEFIKTTSAPVFVIDEQGTIIEWNAAMEDATGHKESSAQTKNLIDHFTRGNETIRLRKILDQAAQGIFMPFFDLVLLTKSGKNVRLKANVYPRYNLQSESTDIVCISQQQAVQKSESLKTIQTDKLATLGEMATSVAHELNQPLNVIRMAAGNTLKRMDKLPMEANYLRDKLKRISEQTERAATIINHMRMFGRNADEAPAPIQPKLAIHGALSLIGEQLRLAEINVLVETIDTPLWVKGHQIQLEQVLINLLTNARDAINSNTTGEKRILIKLDATDDHARITLEDNGGGIDTIAIDRLFEPFFTTKEMGLGTGLGLSVSYGIIQEMGGSIDATNVNKSACFTILLPLLLIT
ncbi:MAG: PAS domain-containing protein [Gammaproteobacteria bacterium]|nr:PAS domain-containing protein [Gammaproteobacteria bacterium]